MGMMAVNQSSIISISNQNNGFTERKNYAGRQMLSWRNPEGG
jgi:hypothetical protein